jgi:hypothetical protein
VKQLFSILALFMAWQLVPGSTEIVENAVHLVFTGHTAHGPDDAEHQPDGSEHGCSGSVHLCSCHASPNIAATALPGVPTKRSVVHAESFWDLDDTPASAFRDSLFRPPIA